MSERRGFPRRRRRFLVSFELAGRTCSGFTWDLSHTGVFIASPQMPRIGETLSASIEGPGGKKVPCSGKVVRARRLPSGLSFTETSGFCLQLAGYSEDYFKLVESIA